MISRISMNGRARALPTSYCEGQSIHDDVLFIDVRTPGEFREVHIPGALNVPLGDLGREAEGLQLEACEKRLALVCRTGRRAERALVDLRQYGLADAEVLGGGIEAWADAGLPLNRGSRGVSLERQVRIAAGLLVTLGVLLGFLVHPGFFVLSALVGGGLVFAGVTDTCGMAMLLARMPWNRAPAVCSDASSA